MSIKQIFASATTTSDPIQKEELGCRRISSNGKGFVYCEAESDLVIGFVCGAFSASSATDYRITPDISDCATRIPVGIALATISKGHFCYLQYEGRCTHVKTDGNVTESMVLYWSADAIAKKVPAGNEHLMFGVSQYTDSGSISTMVHLNRCLMI